jgi:metal-responsive CopG/Arc/MetJ family transcriptional regulator
MGKAVKVTITLPDDLLAALDKAAAATNLNRSAYIAVAVTNKMQQDEMMKQMPYIIEKLKENELKERSSH